MNKLFHYLILICLPAVMWAEPIDLTNIRVTKTDAGTQIDFALTKSVEAHAFTLANPDRLVIDFSATHLAERLKNVAVPTTEIKAIRSGFPKPHVLRLVLDTNMPVRYTLQSNENNKRLTLNVSASNISIPMKPTVTKQPPIQKPIASPIPIPKTVTAAPAHKNITVVIDAGHGGKDPGAIGTRGIKEKDVVLAIATRMAERINNQPNMHAELTRSSDYFVPLRDRLKLARKGKADLFISIHADSYFNNDASGASIYTLSRRGASTVAAKWLAQRENYSELGGVDLGELKDQSHLLRSVLIDLAQTATTTDSLRLGTTLLDSLDAVTNLHYSRVEQAPFMVLKSPDIPSILVEIGFISNAKEAVRLHDKKYQDELADALFTGITTYLKKYPMTG